MNKQLKLIFLLFSVFLFGFSSIYAADRNLPGIKIITRAERGANDSLRYSNMSKIERDKINSAQNEQKMNELRETDSDKYRATKEQEYKSKMANDYLKSRYAREIDLDWVKYDSNGKYLRWPEYIKNNKTKIIVHHTASDNTFLKNKSDVLDYLSGVYRYHTITNGWGDIGYNFIIDPFGNIYEGRAGGEGVVGAHAKRNNTPSIGISLIGNFENVKPTKEALDSLVRLSAALAKKYNINPYSRANYHRDSKDAPYIVSSENYVIAGHKDAGVTSCPGKYLYELLPYVRDGTKTLLEGKTLTSVSGLKSVKETTTTTTTKPSQTQQRTKLTYDYFESLQTKIAPAVRGIRNDYINKNNIIFSSADISRLQGKVDINQANIYLKQDINVLLYELTQDYSEYNLSCDGGCVFVFDQNRIESNNGNIKFMDKVQINIGGNIKNTERLVVYSKNGIINVDNYTRKSYAGIPWNTFRGALIFKKDFMKDTEGKELNKHVVLNKINFEDYMKGIAETNDTESATKNEVMSLISKSYALFYMNPKNLHPNIPSLATYNAVDDPRIFQKYVGAGLEKTLKKWYTALEKTKDKIVLYNGHVPLLPYFSCSAGFTYSAKEKRGRNDTPYLQSKFDLGICKDKQFAGHGVGLSGLGAERRSQFGRNYSEILRYYYPGVTINNL